MRNFHSYEDWGLISSQIPRLLEAYSGVAVVQWYGNIERQVLEKIEDAEQNRNFPYADKLRQFLKIWRENELTGSINREPIEALKAATDILAADDWNLQNYFSNLSSQLRKLIASVEELPAFNDEEPPMPAGRGAAGSPPPEFGPEKDGPTMGPDGEPDPATGDTGGPTDEQGDEALDAALNSATAGKTGEV